MGGKGSDQIIHISGNAILRAIILIVFVIIVTVIVVRIIFQDEYDLYQKSVVCLLGLIVVSILFTTLKD